jgi:hypothetical protein
MWFFTIILFAFFLATAGQVFFKEMIKEDSDFFSKVYGINLGVQDVNV